MPAGAQSSLRPARWPRTPRGRALLLTCASLAGWLAWGSLRTLRHPWADLSGGVYSDHFSHLNAARAFTRVGLELWRTPLGEQFAVLTPEELQHLPEDLRESVGRIGAVFRVPGWPQRKPLLIGWWQIPRQYPPGDLLLVAPLAWAYHASPLSFTATNRLLILLLLVYAHAAIFLALENVLSWERVPAPLAGLVLLVLYGEVIHWTLEGFYDAAAMAPLLLCARGLARGRPVRAATAFTAAAAIHFRAFFLAPWAVLAGWQVLRGARRGSGGSGGSGGQGDALWIGAATLLSVCSLVPFSILWPWLGSAPVNNALNPAGGPVDAGRAVALAAAGLVAAGLFAKGRAWLELGVLAWWGLMFISLREAYAWHALLPMTWLAAPVGGGGTGGAGEQGPLLVVAGRLVAVLAAGYLVLGDVPLPWWIPLL